MKKILTTLALSFLMLTASALTFQVDGIAYNTTSTTEVEVTFKSPQYTGSVTIPSTVLYNAVNYNVTSIEGGAFNGCFGLNAITIPSSVTSIASFTFSYCTSLNYVELPNSIISIGQGAFDNCTSLASINIPNSVKRIGIEAFNKTQLYDDQPNGLIYLGKVLYMYKGTMPNNTTLSILDGTVSISRSAFYNCTNLTSISIPVSVTSIEDRTFENCSNLTSISLPNSLKSIDDNAFKNCISLISITIPDSVISIGSGAFLGCNNLSTILIPNSVSSIGDAVFEDTKWYADKSNGVIYAGNVLYRFKGTMNPNTSITVLEGTVTIRDGAFSFKSELSYISLPNSLTSIGHAAFQSCIGLSSIIIPNSVINIGDWAFQDCHSLKEITLPASLTKIGFMSFRESAITSITIPNSVTSIGSYAFKDCFVLNELFCTATTPPTLESFVFAGVNKTTATLYVPTASLDLYKNADEWKDFTNIVAAESGSQEINLSSLNIRIVNNTVEIDNAEGQMVELYDMAGRSLYSKSSAGNSIIHTPHSGIYLLRVGDVKKKIVVY